jgi:hypothetical protein
MLSKPWLRLKMPDRTTEPERMKMQTSGNYNPWADLVLAMLSTGGYSLERTCRLLGPLKEKGLLDPKILANLDHQDIARRLVEAGYDRGPVLTAMFTERLASLGTLADNASENECALATGTGEELAALLKSVKGVGPVVINNFIALRGSIK